MSSIPRRVANELGITTLAAARTDVWILLLTRFIRMFAYGSSTLILALYFAALGFSDTRIGLFMTLTLVGDVVISLALTVVADALGRRNILLLGSILLSVAGVVFATSSEYWILLCAAIVGVISPSGNEIGPFRAVEESTLAHLSSPDKRSDIFAWHVIFGTLGTAGGALACGWTTQQLQHGYGWTEIEAYHFIFWVYAGIGLIKAATTFLLSGECEPEKTEERPTPNQEGQPLLNNEPSTAAPKKSLLPSISAKSARTLAQLCALFFLDSLGSGMIPASLTTFYLSRKFSSLSRGRLGTIMSSAQFISSMSNLFSSSIAKRIGFIKTMVLTHLPASVLAALIPVPDTLWLTVTILVVRSGLNSMDQAPRTAFLAAVVRPEERTAVMGIVNVVKTLSQSAGPSITGVLAEHGAFWVAFVVAGALKGTYDLGLLTYGVRVKLTEE